jgi:hypothetical protein
MSRGDEIKRAFRDILGPLFLGTGREQRKTTEKIAGDIEEQIARRKRSLNVIDTEGEEVDEKS